MYRKKLSELTREELIQVCEKNDRHGIYSDQDSEREGLEPATREELIDLIKFWITSEEYEDFEDFSREITKSD